MTIQNIIVNKDRIFLCAKAFREDATALMFQLAEEFNFSVNDCGNWPTAVYKTNRNSKGTLSGEWTFYLHGSHCRFDNIKTGQVVEVCYTQKPEFGILDGFFLYTYMQTTERFKDLANWFENDSNVYNAIDILANEGILTKKSQDLSGHYIFAN